MHYPHKPLGLIRAEGLKGNLHLTGGIGTGRIGGGFGRDRDRVVRAQFRGSGPLERFEYPRPVCIKHNSAPCKQSSLLPRLFS